MGNFTPFLTDAANVAPQILLQDFLRYAIGAGATYVLVNLLFSRALTGRKIRSHRPPFRQAMGEILISLRTVLIFAGTGMTIWAGARSGLIRIYEDSAQFGWGYFGFSLILLIVLHDAWFYWTHRLIHHPKLFRLVHRTHHLSTNPTPFTAYSFGIVEAVIHAVYLPIALVIIPASHLAAFIWAVHMIVRNTIGHCGYELFPRARSGKPLFDWLTSVTHHDLHHAQPGTNYGLYFTWWDRLMGTEHPQYLLKFSEVVGQSGQKALSKLRVREITAILLIVVIAVSGVIASVPQPSVAQTLSGHEPIAAITGEWATEGYGAVVSMAECSETTETLCGNLIWVWDDRNFRSGVLGDRMLGEFRFEYGAWRNGTLKHPENGRVYRGEIRQLGADLLELEGCFVVFCQSQTWRRLKSLPHVNR